MTKRATESKKYPVMIFLQGENYTKLKDLVEKRKISRFINKLLEEELRKEEQKQREELKQHLIKGYQSVAKNQKRRTEDEIWDEANSDGLE